MKKSNLLGKFLVLFFFLLLALSLKLQFVDFIQMKLSIKTLFTDLAYSYLRVTIVAIFAWFCGILAGYFLHHCIRFDQLILPTINFIRHVSPFAWLPFAIIWFGLGEAPVAFIIFVTLIFPTIIATKSYFSEIARDYIDEAKVNGANNWQLFKFVELPIITGKLINLFRIIWGLGWGIIIAAEMLGVNSGVGFRLLDLRYLLKYPQMVVYIFIMGIVGILNDSFLRQMVNRFRKID